MKRQHLSLIDASRNPLLLLVVLILPLLALTLLLIPSAKPSHSPTSLNLKLPRPARFAYLISGSAGDGDRVKRLLQAVYHPLNLYLVHLDLRSGAEERADLERYVGSEEVLGKFGNVWVVGSPNLVTNKGPTVVAMVLHAVAFLMKEGKQWSWFINLSASDYPLMPQDDLLHIFSYLPRDLNFIEHTSELSGKENELARSLIADEGLYGSNNTEVFWVNEKRSMPVAFKLFVGSSSMILSRPLLKFCIWGWDNLPRTLLMYYTNYLSSAESYFQTLICNSQEFQNTTVNDGLRFALRGNQPRGPPLNLTSNHFDQMVESGSPFARNLVPNDPIRDRIDREILDRRRDRLALGGWCSISRKGFCRVFTKPGVLRPSDRSKSLEKLLVKLLDADNFRPKQCR